MRIVLAGFGVVGRGFLQLIKEKEPRLAKEYGFVPRVVMVLDSTGCAADEKGLDPARLIAKKARTGAVGPKTKLTGREAVDQADADVLVEATPTSFRTGEPGLSHIRAAFRSKKHVVTCNKGPLGIAFQALRELAIFAGCILCTAVTPEASISRLVWAPRWERALQGSWTVLPPGISETWSAIQTKSYPSRSTRTPALMRESTCSVDADGEPQGCCHGTFPIEAY